MITIENNDIDLWYVYDDNIKRNQYIDKYIDLLTKAEYQRYQRFYFDKDRKQYLLTRALVRSVLSLYIPFILPNEWRFELNDYGKPHIDRDFINTSMRFNVSHTKNLIVMAVTKKREVGVDVEYISQKDNLIEMAKRFFSPVESNQLLRLPREKQYHRFFDLWTLKEAYIKACGKGLSIPLDHFSYSFSQLGQISIDFHPDRHDHPENWHFWQVKPNNTHKISMAVKGETPNANYQITMRETIPLFQIKDIQYPISHGCIL